MICMYNNKYIHKNISSINYRIHEKIILNALTHSITFSHILFIGMYMNALKMRGVKP